MSQKTILIADDDRDLVRVLAMRAGALGLEVTVAHDAMTALELCHQRRPDAAILDVTMPAGNGLGVCEMIAGDKHLHRMPVIILTGRQDRDTIRRCHSMCAYYVLKSSDVWNHVEPILRELLALGDGPHTNDSDRRESSRAAYHADSHQDKLGVGPPRGLTRLCELISS
jgi:CheY-like chemotaxis protein